MTNKPSIFSLVTASLWLVALVATLALGWNLHTRLQRLRADVTEMRRLTTKMAVGADQLAKRVDQIDNDLNIMNQKIDEIEKEIQRREQSTHL